MNILSDNHNHLPISLGGIGGKILDRLKTHFLRYPNIGFLYIDTNQQNAGYREESCTSSGFVNIGTISVHHILKHLDEALNPYVRFIAEDPKALLATLGQLDWDTGQKHRAGRILFADHLQQFVISMQKQERALYNKTGHKRLHAHIFTSLAGDTRSGIIIDVITQIRHINDNAIIDIHAVLPERLIPMGYDAGYYQANSYVALLDLSALYKGEWYPINLRLGESSYYDFVHVENSFFLSFYEDKSTEEVADNVYENLLSSETSSTTINTDLPLDTLKYLPIYKQAYDRLLGRYDETAVNLSV